MLLQLSYGQNNEKAEMGEPKNCIFKNIYHWGCIPLAPDGPVCNSVNRYIPECKDNMEVVDKNRLTCKPVAKEEGERESSVRKIFVPMQKMKNYHCFNAFNCISPTNKVVSVEANLPSSVPCLAVGLPTCRPCFNFLSSRRLWFSQSDRLPIRRITCLQDRDMSHREI